MRMRACVYSRESHVTVATEIYYSSAVSPSLLFRFLRVLFQEWLKVSILQRKREPLGHILH